MKELLYDIIDVFLKSEESSADWVKIPILRKSIFFVTISGIIMLLLVLSSMMFPTKGNISAVFYIRCLRLFSLILFTISFLILNINYFRYTLSKNYPIRFDNIVFFYFIHIYIFATIYSDIYFLFPHFYIYPNPAIEPSLNFIKDFKVSLVRLDFIIYSAFKSLSSNYYKISSNSILPSILNWIQSLYTLSIVALLIASYVNQKVHPKSLNTKDKQKNLEEAKTTNSGMK